MKLANWMGSVVVAAALLTGTRTASASAAYLGAVAAEGWAGDCILCHTGHLGMAGTATQPFAVTLKDKGLKGGGATGTLDTALGALGTTDTDKDKVTDLAELEAGTNPNDADGGKVELIEPVEYGCFNSIVGRRDLPASGVGVLAGLLTAAALWRTRRRNT